MTALMIDGQLQVIDFRVLISSNHRLFWLNSRATNSVFHWGWKQKRAPPTEMNVTFKQVCELKRLSPSSEFRDQWSSFSVFICLLFSWHRPDLWLFFSWSVKIKKAIPCSLAICYMVSFVFSSKISSTGSASKRWWVSNPNTNSGLHLLKVESMGDVVGREEGGNQVGDGASLTTVGTKLEGVQSPLPVEGQITMLWYQ